MPKKPHLVASQVKEARQRAWEGEPIKEIAASFGVSYQVAWWAITGQTWSSIGDPPPLPLGMSRKLQPPRRCRNPKCRQKMAKGQHLADGLCPACYSYQYRNPGHMRDPDDPWKLARIEIPDLDNLYRRYQAGESIESLATGRDFSGETLTRRFKEAGYEIRANTEYHQKLTAAQVRQARRLHYRDGWRICDVAELLGQHYLTVTSAVKGDTWAAAGGLPLARQASHRCQRCGILGTSDVCHFCRREASV